jgi:citrate synthase
LGALAGPRHGGACDRVEALVAEAGEPAKATRAVHDRARRGEPVPGFTHPLYPDGDPRCAPLFSAARALRPDNRVVLTLGAIADAMAAAFGAKPTMDLGLVALAGALGLPPGSAAGLFALGRTAGWVAHILEQAATDVMLRPRARYAGPG